MLEGHGSSCGVADGVGGWADQGVDSGEYSRALMKEAHRHLEEQLASSQGGAQLSTLDALVSAYRKCTMLGSSTACLASLNRDQLETLNLGDSGFLLLRPQLKAPATFQIIHRTVEQVLPATSSRPPHLPSRKDQFDASQIPGLP